MEENKNLNSVSQPETESSLVQPKPKKKILLIELVIAIIAVAVIALILSAKKLEPQNITSSNPSSNSSSPIIYQLALADVPFVRQTIDTKPEIAQNFSLSEIKNIQDMEKAYGFTFSSDELAKLEQNKFVIKNLLDTNLPGANGLSVYDNNREFVALYQKIGGDFDYKNRTQANAVFISSDVMMNLFSILSADLLKETENNYLYDQTLSITKVMYDQASERLTKATSADEQKQWTKVRNYFAVPYVLLSNSVKPMTARDYWNSSYAEKGMSVEAAQSAYQSKDKDADSYQKDESFVKGLNLGTDNEKAVLADLKQAYDASESKGIPAIFEEEFNALPPKIQVKIPFTLFKPRGTYTSSSLRRQYFRAVQWYQQIPFLLASKDLTNYAVDIGELVNGSADVQKQYKSFSSLIAFIVGESDDLDVSDYAAAVSDLGSAKAHDTEAVTGYLVKRKPESKIKAMPVNIDPDAGVTVADEIKALRGMRFMSAKFIPDSYWTSRLTQGDEEPEINGKKLPGMASSLEVMSILGSPYAISHLKDLPYYAESKQAVDARLAELKSEAKGWSDSYWQSNLYTSTLWSVSGMFNWLDSNRSTLPQFMQSSLWNAKTLLTGSAFWTELRHTSLLYAKQSFAEKGAGGSDSCDLRKVPEPPKGYVEPQAEAYDRLYYTAKRLLGEYKAREFKLQNLPKLENYIQLLNTVREYTKLELENNIFNEEVITKTRHSSDDNKDCVEYFISLGSAVKRSDKSYLNPDSRWEELRKKMIDQMASVLPIPVEGPILQIKDKRTAVVADIHTDKDGNVLEEGTGVPRIIFVAVKDANGPRLTIGFTYSQYETITGGDRLTDEAWQSNFYTDAGGDYSITYKPKNTWPTINLWFRELLGNK
ncbi:MAG: DUF3160 domain-containing protein [Candidatus Gracilibacteria bacterium]